MGMVGLEKVDTQEEKDLLRSYIAEHGEKTGSTVAASILKNWDNELGRFVKVMPHDFKRVLMETAQQQQVQVELQHSNVQGQQVEAQQTL